MFLLWPEEVEELAKEAGLVLEKSSLFTNPLTAGHVKLESALKVFPKSCVMWLEESLHSLPACFTKRMMVHSSYRFRKG